MRVASALLVADEGDVAQIMGALLGPQESLLHSTRPGANKLQQRVIVLLHVKGFYFTLAASIQGNSQS